LGLPDPADRALPERVNLLTKLQAALRHDSENPSAAPKAGPRRHTNNRSNDDETSEVSSDSSRPNSPSWSSGDALRAKFDQVGIKQIALSKFHTAILTTESRGNLSLSGVSGSVCRLGQRGVHSQYPLVPMQETSGGLQDVQVVRVALGTDHTLAVTSRGDVYSWGGNRFAQLGYVIDDGSEGSSTPSANTATSATFSTSTNAEPSLVQPTPRRIIGTLKKENVIGCAASRLSSACWTSEKGGLWTWGTNMGHLGYDKAMTQGGVQVMPRKVTGITQGLVDVAMTVSCAVFPRRRTAAKFYRPVRTMPWHV
jgi:alpha-tubulin suppressor-like RCC1 family protein